MYCVVISRRENDEEAFYVDSVIGAFRTEEEAMSWVEQYQIETKKYPILKYLVTSLGDPTYYHSSGPR